MTVDEDNDKTRTVYFLNYYLSASVANRNIHTYFANNSNRPINTTNSLKNLKRIDIDSKVTNQDDRVVWNLESIIHSCCQSIFSDIEEFFSCFFIITFFYFPLLCKASFWRGQNLIYVRIYVYICECVYDRSKENQIL